MCTEVGNMIRIWVRPEIPEASVFYKALAFVPVLGLIFAEVVKASLNEKIGSELRQQQPRGERVINLIKVRKDYCQIGVFNWIVLALHSVFWVTLVSPYFSNMVILSSLFSLTTTLSVFCIKFMKEDMEGYERDSHLITLTRNNGIQRNMDYV